MRTYPFTNAGFVELQTHLYALSDSELHAEAASIHLQFNTWMEANFELNTQQILFLVRLDARMTDLLAFLTSFAVENRRPISLHKEEPPPEDDGQGKIIRPKSTLAASAGVTTPFAATGQLEIHITY